MVEVKLEEVLCRMLKLRVSDFIIGKKYTQEKSNISLRIFYFDNIKVVLSSNNTITAEKSYNGISVDYDSYSFSNLKLLDIIYNDDGNKCEFIFENKSKITFRSSTHISLGIDSISNYFDQYASHIKNKLKCSKLAFDNILTSGVGSNYKFSIDANNRSFYVFILQDSYFLVQNSENKFYLCDQIDNVIQCIYKLDSDGN